MNLREKISEVIEQNLHPIPEEKRAIRHKFYYQNVTDNLILPMAECHRKQYGEGSGGELEAKGTKPAKMASLVSSSAMTFNLLGNETVTVREGKAFAPGVYNVEYEKQLYTLNKGSNPANLDAFLSNEEAGEAVFCEMKILEWLGKPGALKDAYRNPDYYFDREAYEVFSALANALSGGKPSTNGQTPSPYTHYDCWQMFKHTLAIYNGTSVVTSQSMNKKRAGQSLAGRFSTVTLANVVFELDEELIADAKVKKAYHAAMRQEQEEASHFISLMYDPRYGLRDLFRKHCDVNFAVVYMPVHEFADYLVKRPDDLAALKRYGCT